MISADRKLYTVTEIARALGCAVHRARYAIDSRRIQPVGRIGIVRVFDGSAVEAVRESIQQTESLTRG